MILREIYEEIMESTDYEWRKKEIEGISGNYWELDGLLYKRGELVGYYEAKNTSPYTKKGTYATQIKKAYTEVADFRDREAIGAVIVPKKRDVWDKDWESLLQSVRCMLVESNKLEKFIERIQESEEKQ